MIVELFLILFVIIVLIAVLFAPIGMSERMDMPVADAAPAGTGGILMPANHVKKDLSVRFADTRDERVFSKKTGKVKYDKVGLT